ncbi:MAG: hypothetical protein ACLPWG_26155 [Steroidobacteraceae bacterium]
MSPVGTVISERGAGARQLRRCLGCRHFNHAPAALEAALPGLSSLSSAYAAVRGDDGICGIHDRYVAGSSVCAQYA